MSIYCTSSSGIMKFGRCVWSCRAQSKSTPSVYPVDRYIKRVALIDFQHAGQVHWKDASTQGKTSVGHCSQLEKFWNWASSLSQ